MNNVNMAAGMNPMAGGPVGAGNPMPPGPNNQNPMMQNHSKHIHGVLNTYIYEYFLREGMVDCARSMAHGDVPLNTLPKTKRDENGKPNGVGDDAMDTDSKDGSTDDLPAPNIPTQGENGFLYEWFALFWDFMIAQRNKTGVNPQVAQFVTHQQTASLRRQNQQQELLRSMRPDGSMYNQNPMMRQMGQNGMPMKPGQQNLARTAMANNQNNPQMTMLQAKQGQMQRDPSADMDGNRNRPASPNGPENAPSPSKRPRLEGGNQPFNGAGPQGNMMPNGQRPQQGMPGQQVGNSRPNNNAESLALLQANGISPGQLTPQQLQQFQAQPPAAQKQSIATYAQTLQQHQAQQMPGKQMPNGPGGPPGQGSPMIPPGAPGPDGSQLNTFYNPGDMGGPGGMRPGPGAGGGAPGGSNHALQDYQMQLMLLEQQNKKRLMMARQEQDSMGPRPDGAPGPPGGPAGPGGPGGPPGANGQAFNNTSPEAGRPGASPNPADQMKRGTPQMNPAGIPSPLPEGAQSRGSPNPIGFMPGQQNNMDPNMPQHFFKGGMNGMENGMAGAGQMNGGMRPPSSHPGQTFNGQMTPQQQQQMMAARQGQQAGPGGPGGPGMQQWPQQGPNGNMPPQGGPQGQQVQGTPQQRAMPPPSAPGGPGNNANAAGPNGRTQPSSPAQGTPAPPTPQQTNKAAPKKKQDTKNTKKGAAAKKGNQPAGGATPAADNNDAEPPTPQTPITPAQPGFQKNGPNPAGGAQPGANAPASAAPSATAPVAQHSDQQMNSFPTMDNNDPMGTFNMDFTNPLQTDNVLQDFDFDSFLHEDTESNQFDFNPASFGMDGATEIGAD